MNKRPKILVVDNQPDFMNMTKNSLGVAGYQVVTASDRKNGLDRAKKEIPALIIVGALEPRGDAFKLNKELGNSPETQNTPMLVVDVRPEEHLQKGWRLYEGRHMKAEGYISKPLKPVELVMVVKMILDRVTCQRPIDSIKVLQRMEETLNRVEELTMLLAR